MVVPFPLPSTVSDYFQDYLASRARLFDASGSNPKVIHVSIFKFASTHLHELIFVYYT